MGAGEILLIALKAIGLYLLALALFRVMGKRTMGDMEPLDFVVVIVIAEIVGAPLADPELSLVPAVAAVVTIALLQLSLAYLALKSRPAATLLEGKPVVLIEGGEVLSKNLRRARMTEAELRERLRERGYLDPADVEIAVLETDGMLSAIPRREVAPVTPRFLGKKSSAVVALRGRPQPEGLRKAGMTETDLLRLVRERGVDLEDTDEVIVDPQGRLHLVLSAYTDRSGGGKQGDGQGGDPERCRGRPVGRLSSRHLRLCRPRRPEGRGNR